MKILVVKKLQSTICLNNSLFNLQAVHINLVDFSKTCLRTKTSEYVVLAHHMNYKHKTSPKHRELLSTHPVFVCVNKTTSDCIITITVIETRINKELLCV